MIRPFALFLALVASTLPASAQSWQTFAYDSGGLIYGSVRAPENSLVLTCNTPSPARRPLHETDDHETPLSAPFEMFLEVSFRLVSSNSAADQLTEATLIVDGTGYRLPPVAWDEFIGTWHVRLPMEDALFAALFDATSLVFDAGRGTAWAYPTEGLGQGLSTAMQACVDGWAVAGQTIPVTLSRFWREGAADALSVAQAVAALPNSPVAAPSVPAAPQVTPQPTQRGGIPQSVIAAAGQGCENEGISLTRDQLQIADMDEDGIEDFLLNHQVVRCTGSHNMMCGAANCSIDVFLSTQGYVRQEEFLGISAAFVPLEMGRTGIQIAGTYSLCGETGLCPGPLVWLGSSFELNSPAGPAPQPAAPALPKN